MEAEAIPPAPAEEPIKLSETCGPVEPIEPVAAVSNGDNNHEEHFLPEQPMETESADQQGIAEPAAGTDEAQPVEQHMDSTVSAAETGEEAVESGAAAMESGEANAELGEAVAGSGDANLEPGEADAGSAEVNTDSAEASADSAEANADSAEANADSSEANADPAEANADSAEAKAESAEVNADSSEAKPDSAEGSEDAVKESAEVSENADGQKEDEEKKPADNFDMMLSGSAHKGEEEEEDKKEDDVDKVGVDEAEKKADGGDKKEEAKENGDDRDGEEKKESGEEKKDLPLTTVPLNAEDEIVLLDSDKVVNDEKFFEDLKDEAKEYFRENLPKLDAILPKLCCVVCNKQVSGVIGVGAYRHPHLGVVLCRECRKFYGDGDWPLTEDGYEYCRCCAQGGDILLCDKCPNAFCKKCLNKHLGRRTVNELTKEDAGDWSCLVCDPKPIYHLMAIYYCVYKEQDEIKARKAKDDERKAERAKATKAKKVDQFAKEKQQLMASPKNFLEQNISEAFKTLEVYQKSLEAERVRCIKTLKDDAGISVEMATSITRKLRKLYAVTQKNMDLLDRAIVESFVENYPTESTRIHMGRVAPNDPPTPIKKPKKKPVVAKAKAKAKKSAPAKKKIIVKTKKKSKGTAARMNGKSSYDDYVVKPSLLGKKKRKAPDSDIECIDVSESDGEYYRPKKKSRPGPASAKNKKKIGPRSKTSNYY